MIVIKKRASPERHICTAFAKCIFLLESANYFPAGTIWFHVPNGQRAGADDRARQIAGGMDKAMGVKVGISDYLFVAPQKTILWLEAKAPYGSQSSAQADFEEQAVKGGHYYKIFRSPEEGLDAVEEYIGKKMPIRF
jgi:hypothetical protein